MITGDMSTCNIEQVCRVHTIMEKTASQVGYPLETLQAFYQHFSLVENNILFAVDKYMRDISIEQIVFSGTFSI